MSESLISLMAKVKGARNPSFSPDGKEIAFISNITGIPQVWITPIEAGWPRLVTDYDDQIKNVSWSPTSDILCFSLAPGGGMNEQLYIVNKNGTNPKLLTEGGKETNYFGKWSPDGKFIYYCTNKSSSSSLDLYMVNIETSEQILISKNEGFTSVNEINSQNSLILQTTVRQRSDSEVYLIQVQSKKQDLLTPHAGSAEYYSPHFGLNDNEIYLISNHEDKDALYKIMVTKDGIGPIQTIMKKEDSILEFIQISQDKKFIALCWNSAGKNSLEILDLNSLNVLHTPELPTEVIGDISFSSSGMQIVMVCSGSTTPENIWVYDLNNKTMKQITFCPHAGIDLKSLIRPILHSFDSHDGLRLTGWLYLPHNFIRPGPVVLNFHGGPEGQDRPIFKSQFQALLTQGIAVFSPNIRGSSGFGRNFVNLDNGELRFNAIKDIKSCADYLLTNNIAHQNKLGIMGGSYGGYMVMAGLTEYPNLFKAGANLFGIVNFETFFANTEPWMAEVSKIKYGDPVTQKDLLRKLSPIYKIDRVKGATLVLHGKNDTNVPLIEAEQVVEELNKKNVPVKMILFEDEGHGFLKSENVIKSITEIVKWFENYLND